MRAWQQCAGFWWKQLVWISNSDYRCLLRLCIAVFDLLASYMKHATPAQRAAKRATPRRVQSVRATPRQASTHHVTPRLTTPDVIAVNFQPQSVAVPAGYLKDTGQVFGDRGNGHSYGWSCDLTADSRDRETGANDLMDTFIVPDRSSQCATTTWEIEVDNGLYNVYPYFCDTAYGPTVSGCSIEGQAVGLSGTQPQCTDMNQGKWSTTVQVADGRLTFQGEWDSGCSIINSIAITRGFLVLSRSPSHAH